MAPPRRILLDDRLLIETLLSGLDTANSELFSTSCWYFRACRAAVAGAGGHLSGPFEGLAESEQAAAILSLLEVSEVIALPSLRATVPAMAQLSRRYPRLNLLNLEAVAAAVALGAAVWLSPPTARGVLPGVLDAETVDWTTVPLN